MRWILNRISPIIFPSQCLHDQLPPPLPHLPVHGEGVLPAPLRIIKIVVRDWMVQTNNITNTTTTAIMDITSNPTR